MTIENSQGIQTPAGLVKIGDEIEIDLGNDPVARNYNWPERAKGKVNSGHADYLLVDMAVPVPKHLKSPIAPLGFSWRLSKETASQVTRIVRSS